MNLTQKGAKITVLSGLAYPELRFNIKIKNKEYAMTTYQTDYPAGMMSEINLEGSNSVIELVNERLEQYHDKSAFSCMGQSMSYGELDKLSSDFASYLQHETDLKPGDRVAIQLPNVLQYPVVAFGILKAGMVIVNTNPLYTSRELLHQFNDSGARLLVVYAGMAKLALSIQSQTPISKILVTEIADFHSGFKRPLINLIVKHIKKLVPSYNKNAITPLNKALQQGALNSYTAIKTEPEDTVLLQYTGGTTGVSKGAMITNKNLIANMLQLSEFLKVVLDQGNETFVAPLPLYHIYAFTINCLACVDMGNHSLLIPNPRDIPGFIKTLKSNKFTGFLGLNTLFVALMNHPEFKDIDFSNLKLTGSGGMALTNTVAQRWEKLTGCSISEGYGLTETSPVVSFNPPGHQIVGTVGIAAPSTDLKVIDDSGQTLGPDEAGELCVKGPQVMKGYWKKPQETQKAIDKDGWLKTGDVAEIQQNGYIKIVDRIKDMIVVSGFNVYPNEIEDVVGDHPNVVECAAIGVKSEKTGEAVCLYLVVSTPVPEEEIIAFCKDRLTSYKVPKQIIFKEELPKSNVGKILRRELRH